VGVDTSHALDLVTHPLGLQDVADLEVIEPSLMTVAQAVWRQASADR
jgi:hypothetical protein